MLWFLEFESGGTGYFYEWRFGGFEIARHMILKGYQAIVVRYNTVKHRAEHYAASTVSELMASKGSKYIPSYTADGFSAINKRGKYVIVGLPCQADSIRRYMQKIRY